MNTHSLRPMFNRRHATPFTFFFLLIVVVVFVPKHSSAVAVGGRRRLMCVAFRSYGW